VSRKPVIPRELARRDVEAAIDHYTREAGLQIALGFIDALRTLTSPSTIIPPQDLPVMRMSSRFQDCAAAP
jgi:plasmid stabilization system protein ParE